MPIIRLIATPITRPIAIASEIIHQPDKAFPVIDFLKGISVLMVILFHVFFAVFFLFKKDVDKLEAFIQSIPSWMQFVLSSDKAVDIFFLLSSFLLSYGLLKVYHKQQSISIKRFYLHRFFRIYPLFLAALLLYGLADPHKLITEGWYSLLFIENIFSKGIIPVQWSLSIEVQFYLILPFLILFLVKQKSPILWLSLLIALSVLIRFWLAYQTPLIYQTPWYEFILSVDPALYMDTMYYVIETRITPLLLGVLWAFILWYKPHYSLSLSPLLKAVVLLVGLSLVYLSMQYPFYNTQSSYYHPFNEQLNLAVITLHRFVFSGSILLMVLLFHYDRNTKISPPLVRWKGWRLLSEVAYPMYFFHFPFIALAWVIVLGTVDFDSITQVELWRIPLVFLLATGFTLYLSLWLNYWIEARFIRMGKHVESRWFSK
ncbi:MAG: acyltransferase family protein [Thiomicrorhabdus sp.]|nr:acyltransferase family protein [Thiomicrorhabdus sp.]